MAEIIDLVMRRHVNSLASAMAPLAVGIAGVGAVGVKTFMDFDQTITGAAVKAGATAEEMKRMKDAAAAMGAKFPTTARDVAAGMDRLAAGGFNANQAIGSMPGIIEAAIASGEDMAVTSDVVTSRLVILQQIQYMLPTLFKQRPMHLRWVLRILDWLCNMRVLRLQL